MQRTCPRAFLHAQENAEARTAARRKRERKSRGHQSHQHHSDMHACWTRQHASVTNMPKAPAPHSYPSFHIRHQPHTAAPTAGHKQPRVAVRHHSLLKCHEGIVSRTALGDGTHGSRNHRSGRVNQGNQEIETRRAPELLIKTGEGYWLQRDPSDRYKGEALTLDVHGAASRMARGVNY